MAPITLIDARLAVLKQPSAGQIYVSRTKGIHSLIEARATKPR